MAQTRGRPAGGTRVALRRNLRAACRQFWSLWALMFVDWPPVPLNLPPQPQTEECSAGDGGDEGARERW